MQPAIDAIVLGLSPTGLYAARELAGAGRRVLGVDSAFACARYSRALQHHWHCDDAAELVTRLRELAAAQAQAQPPVLIPTSDYYIALISEFATTLRPGFRFANCYGGVADALLDKQQFHHLCQQHGIATPGVWEVANRAELHAVIAQIPYPCILKPALIHKAKAFLRGKKVVLAYSREHLISVFESLPPDVGGWLLQEVIPGPESNITVFGAYVDRAGGVQQGFTARKLRQYPPGFGSGSTAISQTCTETAQRSSAFLQAIGFQGICGTEFKRDPRDGQLKIIEINPRPTLWFQLTHAAGKRIADAAWCDLRGVALPPDTAQDDGVRWRYALKDWAAAWFYRRHAASFVFPPPALDAGGARRKRCWAVFDWRDPLPALAEPLVYLRKSARGRR